jgi:hypothetical protein
MASLVLYSGEVTLVSDEDYEELSKCKWHMGSNGYPETCFYVGNGRTYPIRMHRLILDLPVGDRRVVDHINKNRLDNRRENLRIVTMQENARNITKQKRNLSSIYIGVSFDKKSKKFRSYIKINGKQIHLGYFNSQESASLAYNKKAEELGYLTRNIIGDIND